MIRSFAPTSYNAPWSSGLLFSRDSDPQSYEKTLATRLLIEEIANSLCDILTLERISPHLLPELTITKDLDAPEGQYFSFWKFRRYQDATPLAPHVTIHQDARAEALVEEIAHFIFDYYHIKSSPEFEDPIAYQYFSDTPIFHDHSFKTTGMWFKDEIEELLFTNVFFAYLECIASTGTHLFFKNLQPTFGVLDVGVVHQDGNAFLKIGDAQPVLLGSALKIPPVAPIYWPKPFAENVHQRGVFDVVIECEYRLHEFTNSFEDVVSSLPLGEFGMGICQALATIIPSLRSDYIHALGYSVASACSKRILEEPHLIKEFKYLAATPPGSLSQIFKGLTSLAFD